MKTAILIATLLSASASALADQYVRPHVRADGTFVEGHMRSSPNSTTYDNYSTRSNTNPYTGERGARDPVDSTYGGRRGSSGISSINDDSPSSRRQRSGRGW